MHEVLVTRGDARGMPFRWRTLIHVPCNVVLIHEQECHHRAQFIEGERWKCVRQILQFHKREEIYSWWTWIDPSKYLEVDRWLKS